MSESKEQKVIVLLELKPTDNTLILNGMRITSIFNKELCLVYNSKKRKQNNTKALTDKLEDYATKIAEEAPDLKTSTLLLNERYSKLPDILSDEYEAIFIVANSLQFRHYSGFLSASVVPLLFVRPGSEIMDFTHIVQPMDIRKETNDSSLWCSYFGRFNNSEIVVVAANDKGKYEKRALAKNVTITRKLYQKFNLEHKVYKGTKSSFRNGFESLELALASDCNLLVILGSSAITPLDWLIGLPERKIVQRAGNMPVLVINPRRDNYILCD